MVLPLITVGLMACTCCWCKRTDEHPEHLPAHDLRQMKFFPNFFLRELMVWYGVLALLGTLAAIFPWELGEKADPFASAPAESVPNGISWRSSTR